METMKAAICTKYGPRQCFNAQRCKTYAEG